MLVNTHGIFLSLLDFAKIIQVFYLTKFLQKIFKKFSYKSHGLLLLFFYIYLNQTITPLLFSVCEI